MALELLVLLNNPLIVLNGGLLAIVIYFAISCLKGKVLFLHCGVTVKDTAAVWPPTDMSSLQLP